jgi:hypothetical protein
MRSSGGNFGSVADRLEKKRTTVARKVPSGMIVAARKGKAAYEIMEISDSTFTSLLKFSE